MLSLSKISNRSNKSFFLKGLVLRPRKFTHVCNSGSNVARLTFLVRRMGEGETEGSGFPNMRVMSLKIGMTWYLSFVPLGASQGTESYWHYL
jgi:hypothetical protein